MREVRLGQRGTVLWFTGLSGSGKSTIARVVEERLHGAGCVVYVLDGDNLRHGLNGDLGFSEADRDENIRRVTQVAKLFVDAGLLVLSALISPRRARREWVREQFEPAQFVEVHVNTPLAVCERRDPKGLYKRARAGELQNFTGIHQPYEPPGAAEITLDTERLKISGSADAVVDWLRAQGRLAVTP